jgi:hypothetical protein
MSDEHFERHQRLPSGLQPVAQYGEVVKYTGSSRRVQSQDERRPQPDPRSLVDHGGDDPFMVLPTSLPQPLVAEMLRKSMLHLISPLKLTFSSPVVFAGCCM